LPFDFCLLPFDFPLLAAKPRCVTPVLEIRKTLTGALASLDESSDLYNKLKARRPA
jgi:hypothetical protein